MIKCPKCGCRSRVLETRSAKEAIRRGIGAGDDTRILTVRIRECVNCKNQFTTYEAITAIITPRKVHTL